MRSIGAHWENIAANYLISQGISIIDKNYHCLSGELDLIALDQETLVFVEVRYRSTKSWASASESITIGKQRKIIQTAQHYLFKHPKEDNRNCRFDVISIQGDKKKPHLSWFKDAFQNI